MPTSYTGVATATQAPSGPPAPGGAPVVSMPNDGESENAASVYQMTKVLADFIAWLFSPRARASQWAESIMRFRNALLHTRFHVDHLGLPAGRIQHWREMWEIDGFAGGTVGPVSITNNAFSTVVAKLRLLTADLGAASLGADLTAVKGQLGIASGHCDDVADALEAMQGLGEWYFRTVQTSGGASGIELLDPGSVYSTRHRVVGFFVGATVGDYAMLYRLPQVTYDPDLTYFMDWEMALSAADLQTLTVDAGFSLPNALAAAGGASNYAVFEGGPGTGNWFARRRSGGGSQVGDDTGVAMATGWHRFRLEFHGENATDNATRSLRFYIDGTLRTTATTTIPAATALVSPHFCITNTGGAHTLTATAPLRIGPVTFGSNIYAADVV